MKVKMPHSDSKVGERVHDERVRQGLSQRDLAARTHGELTGGYVSRVERGDRRASVRTLRILADALDVDPHWLAWGKHERQWAVFELSTNRAWGPWTEPLKARAHAREVCLDGEGLVIELIHP